jgi:hypothetical protein
MKIFIGPYPEDYTQDRVEEIEIHDYDTWSMDYTLALIILPMLRQLQASKHGSPYVDPDDVPIELKPTDTPCDDNYWVDNTHHKRWDYVLNEMIFAFENKVADNWEDQFWEGEFDHQWVDAEDGMQEMVEGPNHTARCDWEARAEYQKRITNGFRLFGKYYENLWD